MGSCRDELQGTGVAVGNGVKVGYGVYVGSGVDVGVSVGVAVLVLVGVEVRVKVELAVADGIVVMVGETVASAILTAESARLPATKPMASTKTTRTIAAMGSTCAGGRLIRITPDGNGSSMENSQDLYIVRL